MLTRALYGLRRGSLVTDRGLVMAFQIPSPMLKYNHRLRPRRGPLTLILSLLLILPQTIVGRPQESSYASS